MGGPAGSGAPCTGLGWAGLLDVDLNGQVDPPGYTQSNIWNLYCSS
jgi:hypothetical protein